MTANDIRKIIVAIYLEIIGRNDYSQTLRDYCFTKYKDGKYYSDCSSSVSYTYKKAGYGFGILNTAGMYTSTKFKEVPVKIVAGQITNPEVLRLADLLLYAGTDNSRPGCVGHVEMIGAIEGSKITLFGHGSGKPKKTLMTTKNTERYNSKTNTKVGNKGLIKVIRYIQDDDVQPDVPADGPVVKSGTWNLRQGPGTEYDVIGGVAGGTHVTLVSVDGWSYIQAGNISGWISNKALEVKA